MMKISNILNNNFTQIKISNFIVFKIKIYNNNNNNNIIRIRTIQIRWKRKKEDLLHRIQYQICRKLHLLIVIAQNNTYL